MERLIGGCALRQSLQQGLGLVAEGFAGQVAAGKGVQGLGEEGVDRRGDAPRGVVSRHRAV